MSNNHHPFNCTKCWQEKWDELPDALGERRAQLLFQLSGYAYRAKQWSQALELAEECLAIFLEDAFRQEDQADALTAIAVAMWELDRKEEAYAHLETALELYEIVECKYIQIWANTKCWWLYQDERYTEAREAYLGTLARNRKSKDEEATTFDLLMIGNCHFKEKSYEQALPYFHEARELAKKIGDKRHTAMADFNIGESLVHMGKGFEGETYVRKALHVFELYEHETYIAESYKMLGMALSVQGKYQEAVDALRRAANDFGLAKDKKYDEMLATNIELAKNLRLIGCQDEALALEGRTRTLQELIAS
jgi:tetratricopeptide (TPR) repeat protein